MTIKDYVWTAYVRGSRDPYLVWRGAADYFWHSGRNVTWSYVSRLMRQFTKGDK